MASWKEHEAARVAAWKETGNDLDKAYEDIQAEYPELDWSEAGGVRAAVRKALEAGFTLGEEWGNSWPD
jgi:hypothetical protein